MDKTLETYGKIYDITKGNLQQAGMEMAFTREAFLYTTKKDLECADIFDFLDYDKETLVQALYIAFFFRIPEEEARMNWRGEAEKLSIQDFQKKTVQSLLTSREFMISGTTICNDIFGKPEIREEKEPVNIFATNVYFEKLYAFYKKFPLPLQRLLKRIIMDIL